MRATHFKKIHVKGKQKYVPARSNEWGAIKMSMSQLNGDQLHCRALTSNDFQIALKKVKATVSVLELKQHEKFSEEFGGGKLAQSITEQRRKDRLRQEKDRQENETQGILGRISSWLFSTRADEEDRRRRQRSSAPPPPVPPTRSTKKKVPMAS